MRRRTVATRPGKVNPRRAAAMKHACARQRQKREERKALRLSPAERQAYRFEVKALKGRRGSGFANVYGIVDGHREIVLPGACTKSAKYWNTSPEPLKLRLNHDMSPAGHIGDVVWLNDREDGLLIDFEIYGGSGGDAVVRDIKAGRLTGISIGLKTLRHRPPTPEEKEYGARRVIQELWLTEISLTPDPANFNARIHSLKAFHTSRFEELADEVVATVRHHGWDAAAEGLTREEEDYMIEIVQRRLAELGALA